MSTSTRRLPGAAALARTMEGLSHARGKRIFHPYGVGFAASLTPLSPGGTGATAFDSASEPVVRLSRALGLPEWLPDPCGLALRVPDAHGPGKHQDLLMVSSASGRLLRHAVLPSRGFLARPYSTLLPYRLQGRIAIVGARGNGMNGRDPTLADLRLRDAAGLEFELAVAGIGGSWRPAAKLTLQRRLPEEETERLDFDPTNTGGGLELAGLVNRLRGPSYRGSQEGRAAAYGEEP